MAKKGLGSGLDALFGGDADRKEDAGLLNLPISKVEPAAGQPRERFDPEALGYGTCAFVGLFLKDPSDFDRVVDELRCIPEVVECHYTTGDYDMFIKIYAQNNHHLLSIIHDKLQPLGIQRSETIISFNEAFNRQFPVLGTLSEGAGEDAV